jgi:hypothetical protein
MPDTGAIPSCAQQLEVCTLLLFFTNVAGGHVEGSGEKLLLVCVPCLERDAARLNCLRGIPLNTSHAGFHLCPRMWFPSFLWLLRLFLRVLTVDL